MIRKLAEYYNQHKGTDMLKEGAIVKMRSAAWNKVAQGNGKPYTFVTFEIDIPYVRNDTGEVSTPKEEDDIPF